jgi:hypothetical protein
MLLMTLTAPASAKHFRGCFGLVKYIKVHAWDTLPEKFGNLLLSELHSDLLLPLGFRVALQAIDE